MSNFTQVTCSNCGKQTPINGKVCHWCGNDKSKDVESHIKMVLIILAIVFICLGVVSCVSTNRVVTNKSMVTISGNNTSVGIQEQLFLVRPLVGELVVGKFILDTFFYDSRVYQNMTETKELNNSMVIFCNRNGCDVVIHPMYLIKSNLSIINELKTGNDGTLVNHKVTYTNDTIYYSGYCGVYKNIHSYEDKDSLVLRFIK